MKPFARINLSSVALRRGEGKRKEKRDEQM